MRRFLIVIFFNAAVVVFGMEVKEDNYELAKGSAITIDLAAPDGDGGMDEVDLSGPVDEDAFSTSGPYSSAPVTAVESSATPGAEWGRIVPMSAHITPASGNSLVTLGSEWGNLPPRPSHISPGVGSTTSPGSAFGANMSVASDGSVSRTFYNPETKRVEGLLDAIIRGKRKRSVGAAPDPTQRALEMIAKALEEDAAGSAEDSQLMRDQFEEEKKRARFDKKLNICNTVMGGVSLGMSALAIYLSTQGQESSI